MRDADIYKMRAIKQLEQAANNIAKMREARDRQALLPWGWTPTHGELLDRLSTVALSISHQLLSPALYAHRFMGVLQDTRDAVNHLYSCSVLDNVRSKGQLGRVGYDQDQKGGDK